MGGRRWGVGWEVGVKGETEGCLNCGFSVLRDLNGAETMTFGGRGSDEI